MFGVQMEMNGAKLETTGISSAVTGVKTEFVGFKIGEFGYYLLRGDVYHSESSSNKPTLQGTSLQDVVQYIQGLAANPPSLTAGLAGGLIAAGTAGAALGTGTEKKKN
jgi:hypothetical protein